MEKKRPAGFTLVEIMVSVIVITLVAAGMLGTFMAARLIFDQASHKIQAVNFARKALDTMRTHYTYTDSAMAVGVNHTEAEIGGNILTGRLEDALNASLSYDVTEAPGGYKEITVKVVWDKEENT